MTEGKNKEQKVESVDNGVEEEFAAEAEVDIEAETEQNLKKDYEALLEEVELYKDKLLRMGADFDNCKKRMEREQSMRMKYAGEPVLKEMLYAIDNLERAIDQGTAEGANAEQHLKAMLEGVELTHKRLLADLEKFEVTAIESIGQLFDPNVHEAMTMEASDDVPANHVITEFEKGYYYKDRLLRAAKVIVSSGPGK